MVAEKALHTITNLFAITLIARGLGPVSFGVLGIAQSCFLVGLHIALFTNQAQLLKLLKLQQTGSWSLLRRATAIKLTASVVVYCLTLLVAWLWLDHALFPVIALFCLSHFVNIDLIWFSPFRAERKSERILVVRFLILVPMALLKVVLAYTTEDPMFVSAAFVLEAALLGLASLVLSRTLARDDDAGSRRATVATTTASTDYRTLLSTTWPLVLSATLITLYTRVDVFMINAFLGLADVGIYTAAVRISEASTYLMTTYIASLMPRMIEMKERDPLQMQHEIVKLLRQTMLFSAAFIAGIALFGGPALALLFGSPYRAAQWPLLLHSLGSASLYFGAVCTQWLILQDLQRYRLYRVFTGLVLNVILNYLLIPRFGMIGAATATMVSQFTSSILLNALSGPTRPFFTLQMRALGMPMRASPT